MLIDEEGDIDFNDKEFDCLSCKIESDNESDELSFVNNDWG